MTGQATRIGGAWLVARVRRLTEFLQAVVLRFYADHCLRHASALAYATLLSMVPLLALMFAVLKGLGVQRRLEPLLLSRLALTPETTQRIIEFIDRTNVGTLGALGAVALVLTVIGLLGSIEASFNDIWRVHRSRSVWRKVTDYVSAVLLVPLLLLAAVAITSSAQSRAMLDYLLQSEYAGPAVVLALRLLPIAMNAVAIGVMYSVIPNRRPHVPSVVMAALVAGTAWQAVQLAYVALQIGVARYNAIYGALSQLPVTLVWLYVSWIVLLAGAEVAAVGEFGTDAEPPENQPRSRWAAAVHLLIRAGESFRGGGEPVTVKKMARELRMEGGSVREVAEQLRDAGLLAEVEGPAYLLARDAASIDLGILDELVDSAVLPVGCDGRVRVLLDAIAAERRGSLHGRTLAELLSENAKGGGAATSGGRSTETGEA